MRFHFPRIVFDRLGKIQSISGFYFLYHIYQFMQKYVVINDVKSFRYVEEKIKYFHFQIGVTNNFD